MANPNQTQQLLNLASRAVAANQALLAALNELQGIIDEYTACTAVTPFTDGLFTGTSLEYLNAYNLETLISVVFPCFQQVYTDTVNYTANAGRNKSLMQLCQPG